MTSVQTCPVARRDALLAVLGRAFAEDPVVRWLVGGPRATPGRFRAFFRLSVPRTVVALGGCDLTDGGGSVWYPPGTHGSGHGSLLELPLALLAFRRGIGRASRVDAELRRLEPAEPHWYLSLVGVDPTRTGRGIGSALLAHRLAQVDAEGAAAYLESSQQRNVPLYERFGFVVVEEVSVVPGAPPVTRMWRPAA